MRPFALLGSEAPTIGLGLVLHGTIDQRLGEEVVLELRLLQALGPRPKMPEGQTRARRYACIDTYVYIYIYVYTYVYMYICTYMYIYMYLYMYILYIYIYTYMYLCSHLLLRLFKFRIHSHVNCTSLWIVFILKTCAERLETKTAHLAEQLAHCARCWSVPAEQTTGSMPRKVFCRPLTQLSNVQVAHGRFENLFIHSAY